MPSLHIHRGSTDSLIHYYHHSHATLHTYTSWQSVTNGEIGATEFRDYTNDSLDIISTNVENGTDIDQCCNYKYQILDTYCARQAKVSGHLYLGGKPTSFE